MPQLYYLHYLGTKSFCLCSKKYDEDSEFWEHNHVEYKWPEMIYSDEASFQLLSNILMQAGICLLRDV